MPEPVDDRSGDDRKRTAVTRRTVLRFAGATAAVGGLAAAAPAVLGSDAVQQSLSLAGAAPAQGFVRLGSGSVPGAIRRFDLYRAPKVINVREVADGLGMGGRVSLREMNRRLYAIPTEVVQEVSITTGAALGGRAKMVLRSDGTYTSSGHMRATGFPSFAYQVTVTVEGDGSRFLPTAFHQGECYGTDTPGDRQSTWNESGRNENIRTGWLGLAENARISVRKEYNVDGVLGAVSDIAVTLVEFVVVAAATNPGTAAVLTLASELGRVTDAPAPYRDWPLGVTIGTGMVLLLGPGAIVPAFVVGGAVELAFRHRTLRDDEWAFARRVFGDTLPPRESIILTNTLGKGNRRYVFPTVGSTYLVNIGDAAFDRPMEYSNDAYPNKGQLLIHELVHTWQGRRWPAVTYYCQGITEDSYDFGDARGPWGDYGIEQQAAIVDKWFASMFSDADNRKFYTDEFLPNPNPDYSRKPRHQLDRFVYGNVRAGLI